MLEPDLFIANGSHEKATVAKLNELFRLAAEDHVHDIHFMQSDKHCRVRFRIPTGILIDHAFLTREEGQVIDEKIRSRARLSLTDRSAPLDSRFRLTFEKHTLDIRVGISPTIVGQLAVCRLLDKDNGARTLADIEMSGVVRDSLLRIIEEPSGLFIVTGPTGSGKTTTLYAILDCLNDGTRNITTIEDPVEYVTDGFNQINVDNVHITFANALRSALRLDPDVILVGEIRDTETANIAVQAANTGHLVLASMHTNNAAAASTRLLDLGVDQTALVTALRAVSAQRLVRKLKRDAESSVQWAPPTEVDRQWMHMHGVNVPLPELPVAVGDSDFKGYIPIIELIMMTSSVRKKLADGEAAIYAEAARQPQFETLAQAVTRYAAAGMTTLTEGRRITSSIDISRSAILRLGEVLLNQGKITHEQLHEALDAQVTARNDGNVRTLGQTLVSGNFCNEQDVLQALGYTGDAELIAQLTGSKLGRSDEVLNRHFETWRRNRHTSLFSLLVEEGFCNWGDLGEAAGISQ